MTRQMKQSLPARRQLCGRYNLAALPSPTWALLPTTMMIKTTPKRARCASRLTLPAHASGTSSSRHAPRSIISACRWSSTTSPRPRVLSACLATTTPENKCRNPFVAALIFQSYEKKKKRKQNVYIYMFLHHDYHLDKTFIYMYMRFYYYYFYYYFYYLVEIFFVFFFLKKKRRESMYSIYIHNKEYIYILFGTSRCV